MKISDVVATINEIEEFLNRPMEIECFECLIPADNMRRKVLAMKLSEIERQNPGLTTQGLVEMLK